MSAVPPSGDARGDGARAIVDYARSLDCIHCGLCLHTCPTYQLSGAESSSPRGRVHLMRAVAEGHLEPDADFAAEMDFCLVCRHCESVCPAGVEFGTMMELTRDALARTRPPGLLARLARRIGFGHVLRSRRALSAAAALLRLAQRSGLLRIAGALFGERGRALAAFPAVPPRAERRRLSGWTPPPDGRPVREEVLLLEGCVMPELLGRVHRATVEVLGACGTACRSPRDHVCCGALHAHNGELEGARELARATIQAFESAGGATPELPVVVNSAGCGAHMKEYGRLLADDPQWAERAAAFSRRVVDLSELLAAPERKARLDEALSRAKPAAPGPVTYDDPCHLCHGQGVRAQPRELLDAIPGLARVELEGAESCCGSAGIYSLLRPADSAEILAGKVAQLEASGARTLVTANPGCQLQWQSGLESRGSEVRVVHLAELLAEALR